ncbi:MAG: hypothetical protein QXS42_05925 [Zestosphaera sp.]
MYWSIRDGLARYVTLVLLLSLIVQPVQVLCLAGDSRGVGYSLVMLGSKTCPYCQALHKFFSANYAGVFTVLNVEDVGTELLYKIALLEVSYNLSSSYAGATPHTLVFNNGTLVAIVIGDVESREFWDNMIGLKATDKVPVYLGNNTEIEIPRNALAEITTKLETLLNTTTTPRPSSIASEATGLILVVAGVMILLTYIIMRRRH